MPSKHVRVNRRFWDRESASYQAKHGARLAEAARAWGVWRIPDEEVGGVGAVEGKDVLELGCGAAQWSIALGREGARAIGIDISSKQLRHARRVGAEFPLVQASAEELPFADGSFDVVFCDHGAVEFTDPDRTVPQVARVLRPGGRFAFSIVGPLMFMCWNPKTERVDSRLHTPWFGMRSADDEQTIQFQLPYGSWIELFRAHGLEVEKLVHLRPPAEARTTYDDYVSLRWARRWPAEDLWVVRKLQA
ncbi:MAG TPA: class I SAM-dependent methyltransferase [Actinomycetota bacterium]|nr:class I SAM-dependent methyltransferase [Actinomycetota bacterium]